MESCVFLSNRGRRLTNIRQMEKKKVFLQQVPADADVVQLDKRDVTQQLNLQVHQKYSTSFCQNTLWKHDVMFSAELCLQLFPGASPTTSTFEPAAPLLFTSYVKDLTALSFFVFFFFSSWRQPDTPHKGTVTLHTAVSRWIYFRNKRFLDENSLSGHFSAESGSRERKRCVYSDLSTQWVKRFLTWQRKWAFLVAFKWHIRQALTLPAWLFPKPLCSNATSDIHSPAFQWIEYAGLLYWISLVSWMVNLSIRTSQVGRQDWGGGGVEVAHVAMLFLTII